MVCRYLGNNLSEVKKLAKKEISKRIDALTSNELFDVFWSGRQQYGGEFDIEAIPAELELKKEAADTCWYATFIRLQSDH